MNRESRSSDSDFTIVKGYSKLIEPDEEIDKQTVNSDDQVYPEFLSGDTKLDSILGTIDKSEKTNFFFTVSIVMKMVIRTSILSMPYNISRMGWLVSIIVITLMILVSQFSTVLLLKVKNISRHSNYSSIIFFIMGHNSSKIICGLIIMANNLGICLAESIMFKNTLRNMFEQTQPGVQLNQFYWQKWFILIFFTIFQIPLVLFKKIERLRVYSFVGVTGIFIFSISLVGHFIQVVVSGQHNAKIEMFPQDWTEVAIVIPVLLLVLTFHATLFPIYKGLKNPKDSKMKEATMVGVGACGSIYLIVGLVGYALYGQKLEVNILLTVKYADTNAFLFYLMNFGFLIAVFISFPIMFFGARNNFISILAIILDKKIKSDSQRQVSNFLPLNEYNQSILLIATNIITVPGKNERQRKARTFYYFFSLLLFAIVIGSALLTDDILTVFNLVGSLTSSTIGIAFPCFFYFMLTIRKNRQKNLKFYISIVLFCIIIPYSFLSVVLNILN